LAALEIFKAIELHDSPTCDVGHEQLTFEEYDLQVNGIANHMGAGAGLNACLTGVRSIGRGIASRLTLATGVLEAFRDRNLLTMGVSEAYEPPKVDPEGSTAIS
jgi:hypothetical protein